MMKKRKLFFVLLLALLPLIGWTQQDYGQHVSMKRTTGDSIQYNLRFNSYIKPVIKDDKVVWSFLNIEDLNGDYVIDGEELNNPVEKFTIDNMESLDFRSFEYDEKVVREALIEFYHAMDGDNWSRHDNWCTDKPIWEWYGINNCDENQIGYKAPWVGSIWMGSNNLSGKIPDCIEKMGPIEIIGLPANNIEGELPVCIGNIYTLNTLYLVDNKISGSIPIEIGKLPNLSTFYFEKNQFEGSLPEAFILSCMDHKGMPGNNFSLFNNNYNGKVSKSIQEHPRFAEFWPGIVVQNTPLDVSDLVIPAPDFTTIDLDGEILNLGEIYKKNKFTLLYKWGFWCPNSEVFNQKLVPAYKAYKDKSFEIIGIHYDLIVDDGLADYIKDHDIPWRNSIARDWDNPNYDGNGIFQWGGTPNVFLVDQEGHIVFNSLMDNNGNNMIGTEYRNELFAYLEEQFGPVDYNYYTSTDYSHDGEVVTLQKATKGNGFDLVFVGEGFTDKDIEDGGRFDQRMNEALEQFFAYEPYTSLRDRFNVYAVKAVSPNAEFVDGCTHAIDVDYEKALEYASKVTELIPDRPMRVTVVYNNSSGGRSFCMMMEDDSYVCYAMDGVTKVLNHESGGHGIGRLLDEYVEEDGEHSIQIPDEEKTELDNVWTSFGWGANVDWRSDPTEVKWSKFISDERYADEKIGVYEGSYLYQYGAYRPTENSMMRYNDTPFNAPSREEIYKRVMKESEGDSWTYDYETFVAFDAPGHEQFVNSLKSASRARGEKTLQVQRTAPPVFVKGTWRDALKKKK